MKSDLVVRAWQPGDLQLLMNAGPRLSAKTLQARFWSPVPALPATYLRRVAERWPKRWDAVVALDGDDLVGWAEFGRYAAGDPHADIGACVVDDEQGHGVGTALLVALLERARASGLISLHADIDPYNMAARNAWRSVTGSLAPTFAFAA